MSRTRVDPSRPIRRDWRNLEKTGLAKDRCCLQDLGGMEVTEVGDRSVIVHRLTCVGDGSLLPILCEAIERNQLGVGLKVRTQSVPGGKLRAGKYTLRTGKAGRATFSLKPKARAFGKKLTTKASGSNALGKAQMKKSTKLPRRGGRH